MGKYLVPVMLHWLCCQLLMINNQLEMGIGRENIPQLLWNMKTYASENISIWCFPYTDAKILTLFRCWPKFKEAGNYREMGSNGKYKIYLIFYSGKKFFVCFMFGIRRCNIFCILITWYFLEFFCSWYETFVFMILALKFLCVNYSKVINFSSIREVLIILDYLFFNASN